MLDVKAMREDPAPFRRGLGRRNLADAVDRLLAADERRRSLTQRVEELRARQNRAGKEIGRAKGSDRDRLIAEVAAGTHVPVFVGFLLVLGGAAIGLAASATALSRLLRPTEGR